MRWNPGRLLGAQGPAGRCLCAGRVQAFLQRWEGTYHEDRLRNDWLQLLGQRRDWASLPSTTPSTACRTTSEVRCYAPLIDADLANGQPQPGDEVRRLVCTASAMPTTAAPTPPAAELLAARKPSALDVAKGLPGGGGQPPRRGAQGRWKSLRPDALPTMREVNAPSSS